MKRVLEVKKEDFTHLMEEFKSNGFHRKYETEDLKMLTNLLLMDAKVANIFDEETIKGIRADFFYRVFSKRLSALKVKASEATIIFLTCMITNLGESTMLAAYLFYVFGRNKEIGLIDIIAIFPTSFPSNEDFNTL